MWKVVKASGNRRKKVERQAQVAVVQRVSQRREKEKLMEVVVALSIEVEGDKSLCGAASLLVGGDVVQSAERRKYSRRRQVGAHAKRHV